jgi:hypothetical protein
MVAAVATHKVTNGLGFNAGHATWSGATSAFSVTAGDLLVVFVSACDNNHTGTGYLTASASGYSFSTVASAYNTGAFTSDMECMVAVVPSTNASQTITVGTGAIETFQCNYSVYTVAGFDTGTPTGGVATSATGTNDGALNLTLDSAPATDDVVLAGLFVTTDPGASPAREADEGAGWTEDADFVNTSWEGFHQCQQRSGSTSTSVAWADINPNGFSTQYHHAAIGVVIKAAGGGGQAVSPTGPTVTVTAGTPTLARTVTPTGPTVTVTAGTPALDRTVTPTGATVAATAGSVTVTGGTDTQTIRPDGDVTRVDWVDEGAATTNLFESIDEDPASDSDYITVSV